jgi:predicted DNA-binding transcriptional regulator AlpA
MSGEVTLKSLLVGGIAVEMSEDAAKIVQRTIAKLRQQLAEDRKQGRRVVRIRRLRTLTGLSNSSIYDLIVKDQFPAPIPLSERRVGWVLDEVDARIETRICSAGSAVRGKETLAATDQA